MVMDLCKQTHYDYDLIMIMNESFTDYPAAICLQFYDPTNALITLFTLDQLYDQEFGNKFQKFWQLLIHSKLHRMYGMEENGRA